MPASGSVRYPLNAAAGDGDVDRRTRHERLPRSRRSRPKAAILRAPRPRRNADGGDAPARRGSGRARAIVERMRAMNTRNEMRPVHPGEILREELGALGLSASALAQALGVPVNRVTMILNGQRGVTADTALRLARYFGTTPQLWLNLQRPGSCAGRRSSRAARSPRACARARARPSGRGRCGSRGTRCAPAPRTSSARQGGGSALSPRRLRLRARAGGASVHALREDARAPRSPREGEAETPALAPPVGADSAVGVGGTGVRRRGGTSASARCRCRTIRSGSSFPSP